MINERTVRLAVKKVATLILLAWTCQTLAADDPPSPGGFRLRPEASTFAGPTADKTAGPAFAGMLRLGTQDGGQVFPKPYSAPCVERENVFEFTEKPTCLDLGEDRFEIAFAVKGKCDVTAAVIDEQGKVVRHLGAGVLGANAPAPFQKNSLKQKIYWNGKDDLDWYHKTPEKLKVRVMLGLKPVFDRLLGTTDPRNLPISVYGFAVDKDGVYVFTLGYTDFGHGNLRKFDHDGRYLQSLLPPPSSLPEAQLGGRMYIEYEPGKKAHHGPRVMEDMGFSGYSISGLGHGDHHPGLQAAVVNDKLFFFSTRVDPGPKYFTGLFSVGNDGSTDVKGMAGRRLVEGLVCTPLRYLAVSPDGKWMYLTGLTPRYGKPMQAVFRFSAEGDEEIQPFVGKKEGNGKGMQFAPGSDNEGLNGPAGIDTDAQGRLYVCDSLNNRIQVFSPDGKHLKTVPASCPQVVQVHKKTGAIYLMHSGNLDGRSVERITKFTSFDAPQEEMHLDFTHAVTFMLDSWAPRPRLWLNGEIKDYSQVHQPPWPDGITILEERNGKLEKFLNFDEEVRKEAGESYGGRWSGAVFDHVNCDPVREQLHYQSFRRADVMVFDLKTGAKLPSARMPDQNDIAFDKRGYLHVHLDTGTHEPVPGVVRLDPSQAETFKDHLGQVHKGTMIFKEVPYDYGVELSYKNRRSWIGGIPVKDQKGWKFFQDGFGVNMRGDIAEVCNIYFIPKAENDGIDFALAGRKAKVAFGFEQAIAYDGHDPYADYRREIEKLQKLGEEVYYIPRRPGIPLAGATAWTFDRNGEPREKSAVIATGLILGLQIDEDGLLYFGNDGAKLFNGKPFLDHKGGNYGINQPIHAANVTPLTHTVFKVQPKNVRWLTKKPAIPLDPPPDRPTDVVRFEAGFGNPSFGGEAESWVEGVEWAYAGLSPGVAMGCSCPSTRIHLDWFKRVYVPEAYRRSIGILDTNGNLIMHLGRYGNLDDSLKMKQGSDDVVVHLPRFIGGTDNCLAFDDWGESLKVLRLEYHAEGTVPIKTK